MRHIKTYEEWKSTVIENTRECDSWRDAGDWLFPTPRNSRGMWKGKFYHICGNNWKMDTSETYSLEEVHNACTESRCSCGTEIPEGIKMIALLLSW